MRSDPASKATPRRLDLWFHGFLLGSCQRLKNAKADDRLTFNVCLWTLGCVFERWLMSALFMECCSALGEAETRLITVGEFDAGRLERWADREFIGCGYPYLPTVSRRCVPAAPSPRSCSS